jgi:hypothetical protein
MGLSIVSTMKKTNAGEHYQTPWYHTSEKVISLNTSMKTSNLSEIRLYFVDFIHVLNLSRGPFSPFQEIYQMKYENVSLRNILGILRNVLGNCEWVTVSTGEHSHSQIWEEIALLPKSLSQEVKQNHSNLLSIRW